jgi:acetylornithine deacetylase/succinyl-diaminopimelate desuccinylase-like protein
VSRTAALEAALAHVASGALLADLSRRVALRTESQRPGRVPELRAYLADEMVPAVTRLGCTARIVGNPSSEAGEFLLAHRIEAPALPTVLVYGHGDVTLGQDEQWSAGLDPWRVVAREDRWYGRGTADNKGQHSINLAALETVLRIRGRLGFNLKILVETGEEVGSPGLHELCARYRDELAADVLIASDGPRLAADEPTIFLGSRGHTPIVLRVALREGAYHSGNWGGLLRNPATVLAGALASIVDGRGRILVPGLRPPPVPANVRQALRHLRVGGGPHDPPVDEDWGEPGLTPAERLVGWNTFEIRAIGAGNPDAPVGAIPGTAVAHCELRSVVGTDVAGLGAALRAHLDAHGFGMVEVEIDHSTNPTRTDPDNAWVRWAVEALRRTTGKAPAILPNLGGTIPNDAFAAELGLPTIWIPHSYPACAQHAPDEHLLPGLAREAMTLMTGLFWDLGEAPPRPWQQRVGV